MDPAFASAPGPRAAPPHERLADAVQAGTPAFARALEAFATFLPCSCRRLECRFASPEDARTLAVAHLRFNAHEHEAVPVDMDVVHETVRLMDLEAFLEPLGPELVTHYAGPDEPAAESAEGEPCPICYVQYRRGDEVCTLPCAPRGGHKFHYSCVLRAIMGCAVDLDGTYACPLCRTRHRMHDWSLQKYLRLRAGGLVAN